MDELDSHNIIHHLILYESLNFHNLNDQKYLILFEHVL